MEETAAPAVRRDDILTLTVEKVAFEGRAVARIDGFVVFIDGAVPGDVVRARVFRKKKQFAEASTIEILTPSSDRVAPRCTHFGACGGCKWQHLGYAQQTAWKRANVLEAFERIGGFQDPNVRETVPAPDPFFYRNKMEFSFAEKRWLLPEEIGTVNRDDEPFALGLHAPGRYDKVLRIDECFLQSPESNRILTVTRAFFEPRGVHAWSSDRMDGELRNLVIREGKHTGERMVFLVTAGLPGGMVDEYAQMLRDPQFGVTTFVHGVSRKKAQVAHADESTVHFGDGIIREQLGGNTFEISPMSFFQTNTVQAERLYSVAAEYAQLTPGDEVWDLYCGTGTIALFLARGVKSVLGIELNAAAVADAQANAVRNGVANARFAVGDIAEFSRRAAEGEEKRPDVIILDPPRAGLHPDVVRKLGPMAVPRIVYVSCNPATSARDCAAFTEHGYVVEEVTPVDMFPHTFHIECVIRLRHRTA